ncbi:hypothetical protein [Nostoc sp.]|uniref:hypothetical protein n=1 Tax=Nostoc sp. TaxID=1180 RepID=UPI002FFCE5AD
MWKNIRVFPQVFHRCKATCLTTATELILTLTNGSPDWVYAIATSRTTLKVEPVFFAVSDRADS